MAFSIGDQVTISGHESKGTFLISEIPGKDNKRKKFVVAHVSTGKRYTVWGHDLIASDGASPLPVTRNKFSPGDTVIINDRKISDDKVFLISKINASTYSVQEIGGKEAYRVHEGLLSPVTLKSTDFVKA